LTSYHHHPPFLGPPSLRPLPHFPFFPLGLSGRSNYGQPSLAPSFLRVASGDFWSSRVRGVVPQSSIARVCCPLHVPGTGKGKRPLGLRIPALPCLFITPAASVDLACYRCSAHSSATLLKLDIGTRQAAPPSVWELVGVLARLERAPAGYGVSSHGKPRGKTALRPEDTPGVGSQKLRFAARPLHFRVKPSHLDATSSPNPSPSPLHRPSPSGPLLSPPR
jgi:hypothetical protein